MGDCIISQGDQMEQVIEARDRFLSPNGKLNIGKLLFSIYLYMFINFSLGIMIPQCVSLFGHLSDHRRAYENRRVRKFKTKEKNKNTNCPTFNKQKQEEDSYDTDSSSDSTWCSWWRDVYGFDMRSKPDMLVDRMSGNENCYDSNKSWCVMTEPLVAFFDPCRVNVLFL